MVQLAPERADRLLDRVDAAGRQNVLTSLLGYYEKTNQRGRVLEVVYRISAEDEMPYAAASRVMERMKPQDSGEFLQLFMASMASYRSHSPHGFSMGGNPSDDFVGMVRQHWKRLPKNAVVESIDEILTQADPSNQKNDGKIKSIGVLSAKTSASFGSAYEYRLFELLPVLRNVDSSAAEDYLKKYSEVADMLQKYPDGEDPASSSPSGSGGDREGTGTGSASALASGSGNPMVKGMEFSRAQKVVDAAAAGNFDDAMASASGISDAGLRAWSYEAIAEAAQPKKNGIARDATEKMLDASVDLPPEERVRYYRAAAETYIKLGETDSAQVTVEKGLAAAKTLYKRDSDPDNPNKAMKAFWPATNAYCGLIRLAGQISPSWSLALLKEISDPDMKAAAESALAGQLLGVAAGANIAMTINNAGATVNTQ
jgi:hypothetical protein